MVEIASKYFCDFAHLSQLAIDQVWYSVTHEFGVNTTCSLTVNNGGVPHFLHKEHSRIVGRVSFGTSFMPFYKEMIKEKPYKHFPIPETMYSSGE